MYWLNLFSKRFFSPIGWPLMKIFTLGQYPAKGSWFSENPSAQWTSSIGLAVLVIAMMAGMKQFVFA